MIDSGANRSYISTSIADRLHEYERKKLLPYVVKMVDGRLSKWITDELRDTLLTIDNHEEVITLDIIVLLKYDVVLGINWLQKYNLTIDWREKTIIFTESSTVKTEDRSSLKVPKRMILVRLMERVLAGSTTEELPPEYKDFIDLTKEREGKAALPEHKSWDYKIDLEEGIELNYHV